MIRWILLLIALASAALGLLTVLKIPDWLPWKLAILAGEFGYWLAWLPLLAAAGSVWAGGLRANPTFWIGLAAAALLVQPCVQAWRLGKTLPRQLRAAFGDAGMARPAFSFAALFGPGPRKIQSKALRYADGLDLDFYRASRPEPAPCIVVIHGGGWNDGDRGQIESLNFCVAGDGFAVADISYRLAPQAVWPAQREDVMAAIRFLKAHAEELAIDPHRIVLLGRSAGGQIAEAVGYSVHDPDVRGVAALYAPADMNFAYQFGREDDAIRSPSLLRAFLGGTPATAPVAYASASGYLLASPSSPPTLLVHGRLDTLVWFRQSERLAAKLAEAKVPAALVALPWATHGLEFHPQGPSGQLTVYAVEWFLRAVTGAVQNVKSAP